MFFDSLRKQMRWIFIVLVIVFGGSLFYVGGPAFFGGESPAELEALARPVAEVDGYTISAGEFQSAFRNQLAAYRQFFGQLAPGQEEDLRYQSLNAIINSRLLLEHARAGNVQVSAGDVDAELRNIKDQFPSDQEYRARLRAAGLTENSLRELIRDNLMVQRLQEQVRSDVELSDDELARAYEQVQARHILIRPQGSASEWDDAAWEQARLRAEELRQALLEGADFAELAREHSADPGSADRGGDVGPVTADSPFVEPFKEVALALEVGEVSEPVRTPFGYHLIEVTERREAKGEQFEEARAGLEEQLRRRKGEQRLQELLEEWRSEANVVIHDPRLRAYEHARQGDLEAAVADYRLALDDDPFDPYLHVALSTVLQQLGRQDEALAELEAAAGKAREDAQLQLMLGLAYREAERPEDAARALVAASETADWDISVQLVAAQVLDELGFDEEARAVEVRLNRLLESMQTTPPAGEGEEPVEAGETDGETGGETDGDTGGGSDVD